MVKRYEWKMVSVARMDDADRCRCQDQIDTAYEVLARNGKRA